MEPHGLHAFRHPQRNGMPQDHHPHHRAHRPHSRHGSQHRSIPPERSPTIREQSEADLCQPNS
eukprot:259289-Prorocentrum_lima.AAC.1